MVVALVLRECPGGVTTVEKRKVETVATVATVVATTATVVTTMVSSRLRLRPQRF